MAQIYHLERVFAQETKSVSNPQTGSTSTFTVQRVILRDVDGGVQDNRFATRIVAEAIDCFDLTNFVGKLVVTAVKERTTINDRAAFSSNVIREIITIN